MLKINLFFEKDMAQKNMSADQILSVAANLHPLI